ncbi:MAG: sulfatase [Verrucomicrobiota bacterium]
MSLMRFFLVALLGCCAIAQAAESKRTNVLFMISDDLNTYLGCYGDPLAKTPNLDKLAARGVRFEKAYCTFPLCGPSRNSFLTGLYPNSSGIVANSQVFRQTVPKQVSLPQAFRQQGYFAARIGKLYHYNVPNSIGTDGHDDPGSWEMEINPAGVDRLEEMPKIFSLVSNQFGGVLSWYASPKNEEHHTDSKIATEAEWVLERCAKQKDRPFFLAVGFFRPHTPYVSPKTPYFDMYPEDKMPVVKGVAEDQADLPPAALTNRRKEQDAMTDDQRRQALQAYYASISFMDAQVGKVVNALDRLGLAENTVIVFTSDHGYLMGQHGLWQKLSLFEQSVQVPLLMVVPGVSKKGSVVKTPVSQLDLYPTLTELAGLKAPANIQGQSLVPLLKDVNAKGRGWALSQVMRGNVARPGIIAPTEGANRGFFGYSLRTARWRYTEWDEGNKGRELYDHDKDPKELINLAAISEHAATVAELSKQLREAVKASLPADGKMPEFLGSAPMWAPNLTDP